MTHDIIQECGDHDLHQLGDEVDTSQTYTTRVRGNTESGGRENSATFAERDTIAPDRKTSEEKYLQGKDEGKSSSKESDVDSGCGSSCHEIYTAETHTTHAQLNVSSLVYCHAQKMNALVADRSTDKVPGHSVESKVLEATPTVSQPTNTDFDQGVVEVSASNESDFPKSGDSFDELIQLAKNGMSTLARKRVDNCGKKNRISDCFQASTTAAVDDNAGRTQDKSTSTDDESIHARTASLQGLDVSKVDSGVKYISPASLCSDDTSSMGKILDHGTEENKSDPSVSMLSHHATTESHSDKTLQGTTSHSSIQENQPDPPTLAGKTLHGTSSENRTGTSMDNTLHSTNNENQYGTATDNLHDKASSPVTCAVQMHTILLESDNKSAKTSETTGLEGLCLQDKRNSLEYKEYKDRQTDEISQTCNNNEDLPSSTVVTFQKHHHQALRIQESLLNNSNIVEKTCRPKSMVLPSASEQNNTDRMFRKVPSLETLHLPSHVQATEQNNRTRSFSATIRRKLSFRERISSDDVDVQKQGPVANNKKLKVFRSFRVNRKKKPKAFKAEETSQSTGCLSDPKQYLSTIDKIFHENTGSAIFSDVPFTIPEISEK